LHTKGWTTDQRVLHNYATKYAKLRVLQRPLRRLETWEYARRLAAGDKDFVREYDDAHFHRSFSRNEALVKDALAQMTRVHRRSGICALGNTGAPRITFLTFGGPSEAYHARVHAICDMAASGFGGRFARVVGATEAFLRADAEFWDAHGAFLENTPRGYGNYLWKPFLISRFLDSTPVDEVLVYLDCGCTLNPRGLARFDEYVNMVRDSAGPGMISFQMHHLAESRYSKRALTDFFAASEEDLRSGQFVGGIQVMRVCARTRAFAREWYKIASHHELIDDSYPNPPGRKGERVEFVDHRHDQSVYSLLAKARGTIAISDETYFAPAWVEVGAAYPFWATRTRGELPPAPPSRP
jgi:hypothetical protein